MNKLKVKIKKLHPNAVIPSYAKNGDAGLDLTAVSVEYVKDKIVYDTGISVEIPEGYVGLVFPRSSISNYPLILSNSVGVIDSGYRGTIKFSFTPDTDYWSSICDIEELNNSLNEGIFKFYERPEDKLRDLHYYQDVYKVGDRIGQLIILPYPQIEFEEVNELSDSERGTDGFGSTNK